MRFVDAVDASDISSAARDLGLSGSAVCVHSSMRSFGGGGVVGGAAAAVDGLLSAGCTILVPTYTWDAFAQPPPHGHDQISRNAVAPDAPFRALHDRRFDPTSNEIDADMGAIPREVLRRPGRHRGHHPITSFSAVGPLSGELVAQQTPDDVFAPLRALVERSGSVLLVGVGLTSMTLLHLAEEAAGRAPFRRWSRDGHGRVVDVAVGGCSAGFGSFDGLLAAHECVVGSSRWRTYEARTALDVATAAIAADPTITRCRSDHCERCADAIAGGPTRRS